MKDKGLSRPGYPAMSFSTSTPINAGARIRVAGLPGLLSLLGTLIVLLPNNPNNMTLPSRDSGVFLYVGWRLLQGDIPYRDIWDHKPPLIYFVDALGSP
jgi:hypothetical protein